MYLSSVLLCSLLPLLAAADQAPLKDQVAGWLDKAKSFIPNSIPNPIDAGASEVAGRKVERINQRNWQRKLDPKPTGDEEWLVYMTGGNKTCFGRCGPVDVTWNESVPLLLALPQSNLHLGTIDCDKDDVLCTAWVASVPSVWHFLVPAQSSPQPNTPLHIVTLNITNTHVSNITSIPSSAKSRYADYEEYTGLLHPIDGPLRKFQVLMPFGYVLWGFGSTPSWLLMIGVSFISRQIMSRRMNTRPGFGAAPPPQGAPATAAAPAPAPASAGKAGGKKKR